MANMLCPRKSRHQCVFILLVFCLIGVYLSYRQFTEAEKLLKPSHVQGHSIQQEQSHLMAAPHIIRQEKKVEPPAALVEPLDLDIQQNHFGVRSLETDEDYITDAERLSRLKTLLIELSPNNWKTTPDADDILLRVKSELIDLNVNSKYSCQEIDALRIGGSYRQSYYGKKNVEHARVGSYGKELVVKSIGSDQQFKIECMQMDYNPERCTLLTNYKLMRELMFMVTLNSPSLIKLEGFCIRGDTISSQIPKKGVVLITETGDQIEKFSFSTFHWSEKLEMSIKILELLVYLENSPVGPLGFDKLHLSDFVIVNRQELKLVDLDNIHVGEMGCVVSKDCVIPEMSRKEIQCVQNFCKGRNSLNNLLWVYRILLIPLLELPPGNLRTDVGLFLNYIQDLRVNIDQVLAKLKNWSTGEVGEIKADRNRTPPTKRPTDAPKKPELKNTAQNGFENNFDNRANQRFDNRPDQTSRDGDRLMNQVKRSGVEDNGFMKGVRESVLDGNRGANWNDPDNVMQSNDRDIQVKQPGEWRHKDGVYDRFPNSNFPGMYDYKCPETRVSWGCVISVRSLSEAMASCDEDKVCESFVIFSSTPENEALMTMVRKSASHTAPEHNYGATLFMKVKSAMPAVQNQEKSAIGGDSNKGLVPPVVMMGTDPDKQLKPQAAQITARPRVSKQKLEQDLNMCLKKVSNLTAAARVAREGRVFTHLGLKGISEHDWKIYAASSKIERHFGYSTLATNGTNGSRFKIQYETNTLGLKRGEFVLELGPDRHHIGSLIVYHLDRVLGLYHSPPVIAKRILLSEMYEIKGDKLFVEKFSPFNVSIGGNKFIKGLLTVAVPPVMRTEKLNIRSQKTIVTEVPAFTRSQKSHLEYVLIWILAKMTHPPHGYLGYKGHLIHFETDLAFNSLQKTMLGYFYNCQFPNTVHKVLMCYKCVDSQKMTKVCGLGEEVMSRVQASGFSDAQIKVKDLNEDQLAQVINNGASSILNIVEQCVHTFGRGQVLY